MLTIRFHKRSLRAIGPRKGSHSCICLLLSFFKNIIKEGLIGVLFSTKSVSLMSLSPFLALQERQAVTRFVQTNLPPFDLGIR